MTGKIDQFAFPLESLDRLAKRDKSDKMGAQPSENGSSVRFGQSVHGSCQQCGGAIADKEEFLDSVTGGIHGRLHERCYRNWYDAHIPDGI